MDVTNAKQVLTAADAGSVSVIILGKMPYDAIKSNAITRMTSVNKIEEVIEATTMSSWAKAGMKHCMEALIL